MSKEELDKLIQPLEENRIHDVTLDKAIDSYEPSADVEINEIPQNGEMIVAISHTPGPSEKSAQGQLARKLVDLMYSGMPKDKALSALGLQDYQISEREIAKEMNMVLVQNYNFPDEARRLIVKASLNKILTEALQHNDVDTILKATKQIASDPDVGLTAPPQNVVNITLDAVTQALNTATERKEFDFD